MMCTVFYLTISIITVDQRYMPEMIPDYYYNYMKRGHIMGFAKKTWKNRIAEYINRRRLTMEDGSTNLVTVARDEGTISQEGDAFNAANMNDLEDRIEAGFDEVNQSLTELSGAEYVANSEQSNIATFDTSSWDDGAYLIFNYYVGAGSFFELLIKRGSNIAITNLTRKSTVNGTVVTMEVGNFWCLLFRKCIYR